MTHVPDIHDQISLVDAAAECVLLLPREVHDRRIVDDMEDRLCRHVMSCRVLAVHRHRLDALGRGMHRWAAGDSPLPQQPFHGGGARYPQAHRRFAQTLPAALVRDDRHRRRAVLRVFARGRRRILHRAFPRKSLKSTDQADIAPAPCPLEVPAEQNKQYRTLIVSE